MTSALEYIEKTLADAYRKEIDQEENVWRSLPFFAATISFQIAALSQVLLRLPHYMSGVWWDAVASLAMGGLLLVAAIAFLVASIAPAQFTYIADEPALLAYALGLDADARGAEGTLDPALQLKETLAQQYAVATHHNRQINQRRAFRRSIAGLAILTATFFNIFVVIRLILYNIHSMS